jgi:hypothetical protein
MPPVALDLPGPSRRITIEPLRLPLPATEPAPAEPAPASPPREQPEPARDPVRA